MKLMALLPPLNHTHPNVMVCSNIRISFHRLYLYLQFFFHASYENIDEAHETAGTATAIKPYPPEHSYGMFQYQNIFS